MSIIREERIGDCRLIQGDCLEVMPLLGKVDAVVTDPPYGIGVDRAMAAQSGSKHGKAKAAKRDYRASGWDDQPIDDAATSAICAAGEHVVIFGGNYFPLPPARCWLVWDKQNGSNEFADCELAWTNLDKPVRKIQWLWNGMLRKGREERNTHPTQKPVGVMEWCIKHLPEAAETILDPFAGSGSTGVACVNLGRKFIGIERDPEYFEIMCRRIDEAHRQTDLFIAKPQTPAPKQEDLF